MGSRQQRRVFPVCRSGGYEDWILHERRKLQKNRRPCCFHHERLWRRFVFHRPHGARRHDLRPYRRPRQHCRSDERRDEGAHFFEPRAAGAEEARARGRNFVRIIEGQAQDPGLDRCYVVLYTNPRGSTSYGEEFANLIHHAYPGDDFDDLNSGVDAVAAKGYIDTNNLFVTGGSGGGVLTCWTIEHTDRFRAAASLYPVINWYSFVLTSDIPWVAQYWFPGNPWDHTEQYMQRSLSNLVAKVKTPTMVMTGEADYRTPIPEAEQFYEALKLLNIDSVLVRVPEEPHGISRRPSHHIDKMLYVAGWFEQHKAK
ncbi:MAG: hypothetical protein DMG42_16310 [Acidobacteria bacterium]|nr:MAG: hypothetical protein DMG42_16310 [Acidobacteriota bacterium]